MTDGPAGAASALPPSTMVDLFIPLQGGFTVPVALHLPLVASENRHTVSVLGWRAPLMLVSDVYVSADEAGEETYLRLLHPADREERWSLLAASATVGLAVEEPLVTPTPDANGFVVRPVGGPALTVMLGDDGTVSVA